MLVVASLATLTSCEKESFDRVKMDDAKVVISPLVMYQHIVLENNKHVVKIEDVTSQAVVSFDGKVEKQLVVKGTPEVKGATVKIKAEFDGCSAERDFSYSSLYTGEQQYAPEIIITNEVIPEPTPEPTPDPIVVVRLKDTEIGLINESERIYAKADVNHGGYGHNGAYNHDGQVWFNNPTPYIMNVTIKYPVQSKANFMPGTLKIVNEEYKAEIEEVAKQLIQSLTYDNVKYEKYDYKASAWSIWTAYVTKGVQTIKYNLELVVDGDSTSAGSFEMQTVLWNKITPVEKAHPDHAGHYHYGHGHGHGHGDNSNAGGGIIDAE